MAATNIFLRLSKLNEVADLSEEALAFLQLQGDHPIQILGKGMYGIVLLTEKEKQRYAIKLSTNFKAHHQEHLVFQLLEEHPNIVGWSGTWSDRTFHALRTEYLEGKSLLEILMTEGPLSEKEAHHLFSQLCQAIYHAHHLRKLVHRDIKAENILISTDRTKLSLIDWGMGMVWSPTTTCLQSCGSPDYSAPEIFKRRPYYGPEVDIWSMGITLYAMVTAEFAFAGNNPSEIAYLAIRGMYRTPPVSLVLCDLISKMLTVSQTDRITISGVLNHPWLTSPAVDLLSRSLGPSSSTLHLSNWHDDVFEANPVIAIQEEMTGSKELVKKMIKPKRSRSEKKKHSTEQTSGHNRSRRASVAHAEISFIPVASSSKPPDSSGSSPLKNNLHNKSEPSFSGLHAHSSNSPTSGIAKSSVTPPSPPSPLRGPRLSLLFWKKNRSSIDGIRGKIE